MNTLTAEKRDLKTKAKKLRKEVMLSEICLAEISKIPFH